MNEMLRDLYVRLEEEIQPDDPINMKMKEEVEAILKECGGRIGEAEYEQLRDQAFRIAPTAEESGFVKGFRYAFCLLMECLER